MDEFKLNPQNNVKDSNTPIHMSKRPREILLFIIKSSQLSSLNPNTMFLKPLLPWYIIGIHPHGTYWST
jgi:hypothetical protein